MGCIGILVVHKVIAAILHLATCIAQIAAFVSEVYFGFAQQLSLAALTAGLLHV